MRANGGYLIAVAEKLFIVLAMGLIGLGAAALAAECPCQNMTGNACRIWGSSGASFYWITDSDPSSRITLTSGPCGQAGESATAYIDAYLNASPGQCDQDWDTPCGGDTSSYGRRAKIKVVGNQEAFQHIFPSGLSFTGCYVYGGQSPHFSSLAITQTNTECDLLLSDSQVIRIVLNAQVAQCTSTYSGSKFTVQIQFYEARDSQLTQFSLLDTVSGSMTIVNNPKTSFDPQNFIPDVRDGTAIGWIEKTTYDLTNQTSDERWKVEYKTVENCQPSTVGINLTSTEPPYTLIPSSQSVVRVKLPGFKRDVCGLPAYAAQDGWSYMCEPGNCYIQYQSDGGKIIFHCDSPADNSQTNKRYLIRRVEYCTSSQNPSQGTNQWYLNYAYNSPAKISFIHNGSDPNDPNSLTSATAHYAYAWNGNQATVSYQTRPATSGSWQTQRQWQVEFDAEGRAIKYDAGCASGCSGSGEFENVTYLDPSQYDLTGYEYLIKEKKDPNGTVLLDNTYEVIDFGEFKSAWQVSIVNAGFELPITTSCQNQTADFAGWQISTPASPYVQICHDPNNSPQGNQSVRPNGHTMENSFWGYLSPHTQYLLSIAIKADVDAQHTSQGSVELWYTAGATRVLLGDMDVSENGSGELVEGQWKPFSVVLDCPEEITELTETTFTVVISGDYVNIDAVQLSGSVWIAGNSKPVVIEQKVLDTTVTPAVLRTAMTRSFNQETRTVTETKYISATDYRLTKYTYTDRTFSRLSSKIEYEGLSGDALTGASFTTTYGGDDPNRIFVTTYPNGKRADVQMYGNSGNLEESYVLDLDNDVNLLRETYLYGEYFVYDPVTDSSIYESKVTQHTNARGGVATYTYQTNGYHYLTNQTEPETSAGTQQISYTYDGARRVKTESRKLDAARNLYTNYTYNSATGFLDSMTVNGTATYYQHNAFGQDVRQTNPDGVHTGKSYGLGGELVSEFTIAENCDPNGADASLVLISQTRYTYTDDGKIETVGHYKSDSEFTYQSDMASVNWIVTKHEYYADGKKKKTIEDYGTGRTNLTTQYFYNLQDELEKVLYPTGKWFKTERDGRGQVVEEHVGYGTYPSDTILLKTGYGYNENGNLEWQSNPDGSYFRYTYDNYDRLKRIYTGSLSGPYTEKFYNNAGQIIRQIACKNDGTILTDNRTDYDTLGKVIFERACFEPNSIDDNKDFTSHFEYDIAGNLRFDIKAKLASSEPNVITTEFIFDSQGRKTQTIDPKGWRYSVYYTNGGLVRMTVDPNDPMDPNAFITENIFDPYGRLEKTIDPMGHYTVNTYNSLNQITRQVLYDRKDPNTPDDDVPVRQTRTVHDNLGNITRQAVMADPNETGSIVLGTDWVTDAVFEPNGLLSEQKTYVGSSATVAKTSFSYDGIGRKQKTTDPENNWEMVYYDTTDATKGSQVVKIEQYENDPDGNGDYTITTFFEYNSNGRLQKKILDTDGDGVKETTDQTTQYTFDALERTETETANDGVVTFTTYDGFGNVKQTIEDYGTATENRQIEFVYNRLNQQVQVKAYDPNDTTSQVSIQTTTYEFDDNGNVSKIIYPDNEYAEYQYGAQDKLITEIKRDGTWIAYWHDWNGNLAQVSDYDQYDLYCPNSSASFIEQFEYNGAGDLTSAYKEIDGSEISDSSFTYNGFGARISETAQYDDGISKTTTWTYDGSGNLVGQSHQTSNLLYTHDGLGRIKTIARNNDSIVGYSYYGNAAKTITYPEPDIEEQYGYDALGRTHQIHSMEGSSTLLDFEYSYDSVGNRQQEQYKHLDPDVYDKYYYNNLRQLEKAEYAQSSGFAVQIDEGRLSIDDLALFASVWIKEDDSLDRVATINRNNVTSVKNYSSAESAVSKVYSLTEFAPSEDSLASVSTETIRDEQGKIAAQIVYDADGNIKLFALYPDSGGKVVITSMYDADGKMTSNTFATYDDAGTLVSREIVPVVEAIENISDINLVDSSSSVISTKAGISNSVSLMPAENWGLDAQMMMSSTPESPASASEEFAYDHLGNRYQHTEKDNYITTYAHNPVNQYGLISKDLNYYGLKDDRSLSYDDNGNMSEDGFGCIYHYDYRNRLSEVEYDSTTIAHYTFDALGRRIRKVADGVTTYFFYDTNNRVIAEYEGTNAEPKREFVYGNGVNEVLAMFLPEYEGSEDDFQQFLDFCAAWMSEPNDSNWQNSLDVVDNDRIDFADFAVFASQWDSFPSEVESHYYYLHDAMGSVRGLIGGKYNREEDREFYNYDVYGQLSIQNQQESTSGNPYLFAGYRYDTETWLYFMPYRSYDPATGRFIQFDPIGYKDGMNLYEYAKSNPAYFIDSMGLSSCKEESLDSFQQGIKAMDCPECNPADFAPEPSEGSKGNWGAVRAGLHYMKGKVMDMLGLGGPKVYFKSDNPQGIENRGMYRNFGSTVEFSHDSAYAQKVANYDIGGSSKRSRGGVSLATEEDIKPLLIERAKGLLSHLESSKCSPFTLSGSNPNSGYQFMEGSNTWDEWRWKFTLSNGEFKDGYNYNKLTWNAKCCVKGDCGSGRLLCRIRFNIRDLWTFEKDSIFHSWGDDYYQIVHFDRTLDESINNN